MIFAKYKKTLLNGFETREDEWTYSDFEQKLGEVKKGTSYHTAKGIINDAHKLGEWPKTVKRYLLTNFKSHGNVSGEFMETFANLTETLSDEEKKTWGIN